MTWQGRPSGPPQVDYIPTCKTVMDAGDVRWISSRSGFRAVSLLGVKFPLPEWFGCAALEASAHSSYMQVLPFTPFTMELRA